MFPLLFVNGGAWMATDPARELCADIEAARLRAGLTRKVMADAMGLSEKQYSDQITLRKPLNIYRLADLPLAFWRAFVMLRAQRAALQIIEDVRIGELMRALDQLQVKMLKSPLRQRTARERQAG